MLPSLIFIVVSTPGNISYIWVLLYSSRPFRDPIRDGTRWWGPEFQWKFGSLTMFEGMDKDIGTCFLVQVVLFVSTGSPTGQKLLQSRLLLFFWWVFVHSYTADHKSPACQRVFLEIDGRSWINTFQSFIACCCISLKIECFFEKKVTIATTKRLKDCINVAHITCIIVVSE